MVQMEVPTASATFKHSLGFRPRFSDLDPFGIVHHAATISYLEEARLDLLRTVGATIDSLTSDGVAVVVTQLRCDYHQPLRMGTCLTIEVGSMRARSRAIDLGYVVRAAGTCAVLAATRLVFVSRVRSAVRVPDWLLEGLAAIDTDQTQHG